MFESTLSTRPRSGPRALPSAEEVRAFAAALAGDTSHLDDAERVELLSALETVKCAAEGAQAAVTAEFDASQRDLAAERGEPERRRGRGVAHQVALARRVSPHAGQRLTGLARVLAAEMPHTLAALRSGRITEWQATLLARETGCLSLADRQLVDRRLCGDLEQAERMGVRETGDRARRLAAELDPASVAQRRSKAEADRCVTVRPAPDTMTWLTGHLPVQQGVAVYAALRAAADRQVGVGGDRRSRSQIMADTLVERVLAGTTATDGRGTAPGVLVDVVIGVDSLLGHSDAAAEIPGHGPVPAEAVRAWIRDGLDAGQRVELRRLFTDPATGELVQMESRARAFPRPLAALIELRDLRCRTSWCDAPVRHTDHVVAHDDLGPTTLINGQGLCQACNHAKQAFGWDAHPRPGPGHQVETTTPTGHQYLSRAPAMPGTSTRPGSRLASPRPRVDLVWAA